MKAIGTFLFLACNFAFLCITGGMVVRIVYELGLLGWQLLG